MNLRNYGWLFGTTLLVGAVGGVVSGFLIGREELFSGTAAGFFVSMFFNILFGLAISALAQLGFFAYMMLNYLALSILKNGSLWKGIQVVLILFTFFDMVYLRYDKSFRGESIWPYLAEPVALLLVAIVTAYAKVNLTNRTAWIPTIFFMFVVTTVEWIPGLKENTVSIIFMVVPLLFCNVWQVLNLQRLVKKTS